MGNYTKPINQRKRSNVNLRQPRSNEINKFALLGTTSSGKTTFARQITINFGPSCDVSSDSKLIINAILLHFAELIRVILDVYGNIPNQDHSKVAQKCSENTYLINRPLSTSLTTEVVVLMKSVWFSSACQELWYDKGEYRLSDSLPYFIENLDRISAENYIPTKEDFVRATIRNYGIGDHIISYLNQKSVFIDVSGQRSELRKWIRVLPNLTGVLFFASVNDFDECIYEEDYRGFPNKSVYMFQKLPNFQNLDQTPIIIFFTKSDLLRDKLAFYQSTNKDIKAYFPNLKLEEDTKNSIFDQVLYHIQETYLVAFRTKRKNLWYSHNIVLTDMSNFKDSFSECMRHSFSHTQTNIL